VLRDIYISLNFFFFWWNESEERERLSEERERESEEGIWEEGNGREKWKGEMEGRNAGVTITIIKLQVFFVFLCFCARWYFLYIGLVAWVSYLREISYGGETWVLLLGFISVGLFRWLQCLCVSSFSSLFSLLSLSLWRGCFNLVTIFF